MTPTDGRVHLTVVLFRKSVRPDEGGHDIQKFAHVHVPGLELLGGYSVSFSWLGYLYLILTTFLDAVL